MVVVLLGDGDDFSPPKILSVGRMSLLILDKSFALALPLPLPLPLPLLPHESLLKLLRLELETDLCR